MMLSSKRARMTRYVQTFLSSRYINSRTLSPYSLLRFRGINTSARTSSSNSKQDVTNISKGTAPDSLRNSQDNPQQPAKGKATLPGVLRINTRSHITTTRRSYHRAWLHRSPELSRFLGSTASSYPATR